MTKTDIIRELMSDGQSRTVGEIAKAIKTTTPQAAGLLGPMRKRREITVIPDTRPMQFQSVSDSWAPPEDEDTPIKRKANRAAIKALMADGEVRTIADISEELNISPVNVQALIKPMRENGELRDIPGERPMQLVNKSPEEMASLCLTRDIERSIRILERYGYIILPPKHERASA